MIDEIGHQLAKRIETKKNCATCRLGYNIMGMVHRQAINGAPIIDIWRSLEEMQYNGIIDKAPSRQALDRHLKNHLGVRNIAIRRHLEMRAQQHNIDVENGVQNILTDIGVAETIVRVGFEDIVSGKIKLDAKDVLSANKQVHDFTKDDTGNLDAATAFVQLGMVMQAIKEIVPEEMWIRITDRLGELSAEENYIDAELEE